MKRLIFDLDGTICHAKKGDYVNATPDHKVIDTLKKYKDDGFEIVINTSRNIRTYDGNIGKINANTLPVIVEWLNDHGVPYDEIHVGKPWCGFEGFYIDDKTVRPSELVNMSYDDIVTLLDLKR